MTDAIRNAWQKVTATLTKREGTKLATESAAGTAIDTLAYLKTQPTTEIVVIEKKSRKKAKKQAAK